MNQGTPYPIQFFGCRDDGCLSPDQWKALTYLSIKKAGPIAGDTGIPGLRLDFNSGVRLQVPEGDWHVIVSDYDSGMVFYDRDVSETILISMEKHYVHWQVEVFRDGIQVFAHVLDLSGQHVHVDITSPLMGDTLALLPYIPCLQEHYHAVVSSFCPAKPWRELCHHLLPGVPLKESPDVDTYATYRLSAGYEMPPLVPIDTRMIPLLQWGQTILGLPEPARPLHWPASRRLIEEPYVCIAVQSSAVSKTWLYPHGWDAVVGYLKRKGYRVLCIDKEVHQESGQLSMDCPGEAEDFTGNRSLIERGNMLAHADFFIGLSSGLSWLAYTVGCPVVMICGFSLPWSEFFTPYRVYNPLACAGCVHDMRYTWYKSSCRYKGTEKYLECSKKISPRMVIQAIDRLIAEKASG